jgi:hypothetical protein
MPSRSSSSCTQLAAETRSSVSKMVFRLRTSFARRRHSSARWRGSRARQPRAGVATTERGRHRSLRPSRRRVTGCECPTCGRSPAAAGCHRVQKERLAGNPRCEKRRDANQGAHVRATPAPFATQELPPRRHVSQSDRTATSGASTSHRPTSTRVRDITGSSAGHGKESDKVMTDFTRAGRQGAHAVEPMRGRRFATARRERSALPRPATP